MGRTIALTAMILMAARLEARASQDAEPPAPPEEGDESSDGRSDGPGPDGIFLMPIQDFLEKSYIFYSLPPPEPNPSDGKFFWMLFEANTALHLFLKNSLSLDLQTLLARDADSDRVKGALDDWALSFTFAQKLRMLSTHSAAVRTPSYMAGFTFQYFWFRAKLGCPSTDPTCRAGSISKYKVDEHVAHVRLMHHSNGQEYCQFAEEKRGECPPIDVNNPPNESANLINGDFSTNYLRVGYNWRRFDQLNGSGWAMKSWSLGGSIELNPMFWPFNHFPGRIQRETYVGYHPHRLIAEAERQWLIGGLLSPGNAWGHARLSTSFTLALAHEPFAAQPTYRWQAEFSRTFFSLGGLGFFVRLYSGQDYYSINYVNRIDFQVQAGAIVDFSPPIRFND